MNFSDALEMLKVGQKIKRFSWDKTIDYLHLSRKGDSYNTYNEDTIYQYSHETYMTRWINTDPKEIHDDILAEDWMVVG